jgi:hypothetical protein
MEDVIGYVCLLRSGQGNCGGAGGSGFSCELISGKENQIVTYRKEITIAARVHLVTISLRKLLQVLTFLTFIRCTYSSNLGRDIEYPEILGYISAFT